jgi:putative Ca2+/H+ antiporter (TMEM165/GDT1 family)
METLLSSFLLVAVSEMGDKTQLLAFSLAIRFKKPFTILAGIITATLLNHGIASFLGSWISEHISEQVMALILALTFFVFALWTLKPDTLEEGEAAPRFGPYLTTVVLFFLAEMGDKTQLATLALAAKYHSPFWVTLGTTLGMLTSDGLAVLAGEKLSSRINMNYVRRVAAAVFFLFGLASVYRAYQLW